MAIFAAVSENDFLVSGTSAACQKQNLINTARYVANDAP